MSLVNVFINGEDSDTIADNNVAPSSMYKVDFN